MNKPTRRVRGNSEPPPDIKYADLQPEEDGQQDADDLIDFMLGFTVIMIFIVTLMFVWGKLG